MLLCTRANPDAGREDMESCVLDLSPLCQYSFPASEFVPLRCILPSKFKSYDVTLFFKTF